jgi:hypothetical protein
MNETFAIVAGKRFGLDLTVEDLAEMKLSITNAKSGVPSRALLQRLDANGSEIWFVDCRGLRIRVSYSPHQGRINSVMPPRDWMDLRKRGRSRQGARGRERTEREVTEVWDDE